MGLSTGFNVSMIHGGKEVSARRVPQVGASLDSDAY